MVTTSVYPDGMVEVGFLHGAVDEFDDEYDPSMYDADDEKVTLNGKAPHYHFYDPADGDHDQAPDEEVIPDAMACRCGGVVHEVGSPKWCVAYGTDDDD